MVQQKNHTFYLDMVGFEIMFFIQNVDPIYDNHILKKTLSYPVQFNSLLTTTLVQLNSISPSSPLDPCLHRPHHHRRETSSLSYQALTPSLPLSDFRVLSLSLFMFLLSPCFTCGSVLYRYAYAIWIDFHSVPNLLNAIL